MVGRRQMRLEGSSPRAFVEGGADMSGYRTYSWASDDRLLTHDPRLDNNPFFLARLRADVDRQLAARGFEKSATGTPNTVPKRLK